MAVDESGESAPATPAECPSLEQTISSSAQILHYRSVRGSTEVPELGLITLSPSRVTNCLQTLEEAIRGCLELSKCSTNPATWLGLWRLLFEDASLLVTKTYPHSLRTRACISERAYSIIASYAESLRRCLLSAGQLAAMSPDGLTALASYQCGRCESGMLTSRSPADMLNRHIRPFFIIAAGALGLKSFAAQHATLDGNTNSAKLLAGAIKETLKAVALQWSSCSPRDRRGITKEIWRVYMSSAYCRKEIQSMLKEHPQLCDLVSTLARKSNDHNLAMEITENYVLTGLTSAGLDRPMLDRLHPLYDSQRISETMLPAVNKLLKRKELHAMDLLSDGGLYEAFQIAITPEFIRSLWASQLFMLDGKDETRQSKIRRCISTVCELSVKNESLCHSISPVLAESAVEALRAAQKATQLGPRGALMSAAIILLRALSSKRLVPDGARSLILEMLPKETNDEIKTILVEGSGKMLPPVDFELSLLGLILAHQARFADATPQIVALWSSCSRQQRTFGLHTVLSNSSGDSIDREDLVKIFKPSFLWLLDEMDCAINKPALRAHGLLVWHTLLTFLQRTDSCQEFLQPFLAKNPTLLLANVAPHIFSCKDLLAERLPLGLELLGLVFGKKAFTLPISTQRSLEDLTKPPYVNSLGGFEEVAVLYLLTAYQNRNRSKTIHAAVNKLMYCDLRLDRETGLALCLAFGKIVLCPFVTSSAQFSVDTLRAGFQAIVLAACRTSSGLRPSMATVFDATTIHLIMMMCCHPAFGSRHISSSHFLFSWVKRWQLSKQYPTVDLPEPVDSVFAVIRHLVNTRDPLRDSLSHWFGFITWKNINRWLEICPSNSGVEAHAWSDFMVAVYKVLIETFDQVDPKPIIAPPVDLSQKHPIPKAASAKMGAKPKVSTATARLLASQSKQTVLSKKADESTPVTPESLRPPTQNHSIQVSDRINFVCQCLSQVARHWPQGLAPVLPLLVDKLLIALRKEETYMASERLTHLLVDAFVESSVCQKKNLVANCLAMISRAEVPISATDAETICASLSENEALDSEASALIMPIILGLLSADSSKGVALLAVHRAVCVLYRQLKLGAALNPSVVMDCVMAVVRLRPSLLNVCTQILELIPSLADFNPDSHCRRLSEFVENDNVRFRRAVIRVLAEATRKPQVIGSQGEYSARVFVMAFGEPDEMAQTYAKRLAEQPIEVSWMSRPRAEVLSDASFTLASGSSAFRSLSGRALARFFSEEPELLVVTLVSAYKHQFVTKAVKAEVTDQYKGFHLKEEDLAKIRSKQTSGPDTTPFHPGRFGCVAAFAALVEESKVLPWSVVEHLLHFILRDYLSGCPDWTDPAMQEEVESLGLALAAANVHHAHEASAMLVERICLLIPARVLTVPEASSLAIACLTLGTQIKHLPPTSEHIQSCYASFSKCLASQNAPLQVKRAIGKALMPVFTAILATSSERKDELFNDYKRMALEEKDAKLRVSGALGLAALLRAQGLNTLKSSGILEHLSEVVKDRRTAHSRHGGFLCFEAIMESFGRLIEPFAVQILPTLLLGLADLQNIVRDAAATVALKLMSCLSAHGLKLVLPELINCAQDQNWRTKAGAIELLGNVANVSPSHLSAALNQVLPVLCEASHDSHKEVKSIAAHALRALSNVIASPELRSVSGKMVACLLDLSDVKLEGFFNELTEIVFEHYIDFGSLAFLSPILQKGLRGEKADIRARTAQIVAVIPQCCKDSKNTLAPYMKQMVPDLRANLSDPLPEVRQSAAKCLGSLTRELGSSVCSDTIPWLIKSLKTSTSSVERSGTANALVEIFYALGPEVLSQHLADILKQASMNPSPGAREGFLGLFVYMPLTFKDDFQDFVPQVLPVLLGGLAAPEEPVRDIAYRASQIFVAQYGSTHTPLLLQPLEQALFNDVVEVRLRAVSLLGSLVEKILKGVEDSSAEGGQLMQLEVLSLERRAYILSALFLARSDEEPDVRQAAASVWKSVVQNTPRTVRELLPILTKRLVDLLASEDPVKEGVSSRCMEELVLKHGEKLLPEVMSIFLATLKGKPDPRASRGVFVGLQAIVTAAPRSELKNYMQQLNPLIRSALKSASTQESRKQIVGVVNVLARSEEKTAVTEKAKLVAATSFIKTFVDPFMKEYLEPLTFKASGFSEERITALDIIKIFLETECPSVAPEIIARCQRSEIFDLSRIRILGALHVCDFEFLRRHWETAINQLQKAYRQIYHPANPAAAEDVDPAEFTAAIGDAIQLLLSSMPESQFYEVVATMTNVFQSSAPRISCSGRGWTQLLSEIKMESPLDLPRSDGASLVRLAREHHVALELDINNSIGRSFGCLIASNLTPFYTTAPTTFKESAESLMNLILPVALTEVDEIASDAASQALAAFTKALPRDTQISLCNAISSILEQLLRDPLRNHQPFQPAILLPGCTKRAIFENVSTILQSALLYGSVPARQMAAVALQSLVASANGATLSASAVKAAGPLIRVFAEKVPGEIKSSVLQTLVCMLRETGPALRPLVPQLQSTFVRCLSDTAVPVRKLAAESLGQLAALAGPRCDLLLKELSKSVDTSDTRGAILDAISAVFKVASKEVQPATRSLLWRSLVANQSEDDSAEETLARGTALGLILGSDLSFSSSRWSADVVPALDENYESMANAVQTFLDETPTNKAWLYNQGFFGPLVSQIEDLVEKPLSMGLCRLVASVGRCNQEAPAADRKDLSNIAIALARHAARMGSQTILTQPQVAVESLQTLESLVGVIALQRSNLAELCKALGALLRVQQPALKLTAEKILRQLLKEGRASQVEELAKSDPMLKFHQHAGQEMCTACFLHTRSYNPATAKLFTMNINFKVADDVSEMLESRLMNYDAKDPVQWAVFRLDLQDESWVLEASGEHEDGWFKKMVKNVPAQEARHLIFRGEPGSNTDYWITYLPEEEGIKIKTLFATASSSLLQKTRGCKIKQVIRDYDELSKFTPAPSNK